MLMDELSLVCYNADNDDLLHVSIIVRIIGSNPFPEDDWRLPKTRAVYEREKRSITALRRGQPVSKFECCKRNLQRNLL
jgi:hypothetical protein